MRLAPNVHLVGSGSAGFDLTHPVDCHVYLVDGEEGWALIDAGSGMDSPQLISCIRASGVDLERPGHLLLTHGHADHSGGAADLSAEFPQLEVWAHPRVAGWITTADAVGISLDKGIAQGVYPSDYELRPTGAVTQAKEGTVVDLGGTTLRAIESPGHSAGHTCWALQSGQLTALFTGDCLFYGGRVSIQNLHDVDIPAYATTVERLATERFDALLPGHGAISMARGQRHVQAAHAVFASGLVPQNIV